uniref:Uncharacterized protein n=1 Tax=Gracilaria ferox TaxID=1184158 RepID=A0A346Q006_9FLOR|nr:hypothetical protein [Gracilaria ferox]
MNNTYINSEIKRITNIILQSKVSKQYCIYKSRVVISNSASEDDWQYCLLILQYVNPKDDIKTISQLLESFLKIDRFRNEFLKNYTYLYITITRSIVFSMQSGNLGCLYNSISDKKQKLIQSIKSNFHSSNLVKSSCSTRSVLKLSNFLAIFYLDTHSYSNLLLDYEYYYKLDNNFSVKISMFGGLLNYFDLMIFVKILYLYKSVSYCFSNGILDINFSDFNFILSDSGQNRHKYMSSLDKLSKVHLNTFCTHQDSSSNGTKMPLEAIYSFSGNLISFERLSTRSSTSIRLYLSKPLFTMFQLSDNYSILNWDSFLNLSNSHCRLLYFYFCLNVKVSKYFTTFTLDNLLDNLYISSVHGSTFRSRKQSIRRMLQFIYDNRSNIIDFDFHLVFKSTFDTPKIKDIYAIKVRRLKVLLTN